MFKQTLNLYNFKGVDDSTSSPSELDTQKNLTSTLKAKKLKAKEELNNITFNWRTENLKLREKKAKEALEQLSQKKLKQEKIRRIEKETMERYENEDQNDDQTPTKT